MKAFIVFFSLISIVYCKTLAPHSRDYTSYAVTHRCINMWDEGCVNGQLGGSGNDDDYLNGGFTPGKRCVNMWDEGCINGQLGGSGNDDDYLNGGFTPGKRCVNMWDEGCINGQLGGSGNDDDYLNGGFNPGKRSVNMWNEAHAQHGGKDDLNGFKKSLHDLFSRYQKNRHHN